jgi:hypothetical protein
MPTAVNLLSDLTSSPDWSPDWMTIEEIAAELERRGVWDQRPFRRYHGPARLEFLSNVLRSNGHDEEPIWAEMGARFKHSATLTPEDQSVLQDWSEARRAAFDEDLCRILLGEQPQWRKPAKAPGRKLRDLLRQARPLVEELSSYVRYEYNDEDLIGSQDAPPVSRRMEELAVALTSLFDRPAEVPVRKAA